VAVLAGCLCLVFLVAVLPVGATPLAAWEEGV
jgi:hypothetical protein